MGGGGVGDVRVQTFAIGDPVGMYVIYDKFDRLYHSSPHVSTFNRLFRPECEGTGQEAYKFHGSVVLRGGGVRAKMVD